MTEQPGGKSGVERLVDLAVYAPVGLALTVAEAMPELARKGRSRLDSQFAVAQTVGELAVRRGVRQLANIATAWLPFPLRMSSAAKPDLGARPEPPVAGAAAAEPEPPVAGAAGPEPEPRARPDFTSKPTRGATVGRQRRHSGGPHVAGLAGEGLAGDELAGDERTPGNPKTATLAIPSYDSLSAPQVVQRLAGLSREEVEAVRAYEAVTRGRRTVLTRAEQLLA
jgi:hypothetical protein